MADQPAGHTLQPTALVHEAYLRLIGSQQDQWQNSRHFSPPPPRPCATSSSMPPGAKPA
jgi:hypothetical protein